MHKILMFAAVAALAGCSQETAAPPAEEANVAAAEAPAATPAAMSLNETTWTYTNKDGKKIEDSIDATGNYISTVGAEHEDHGTMVMVDGKACFTSAMNKDGQMCWTVVDTAIGQTTETTSDKGEKLMVSRVAYVAKTM
ncbi:MAG: hypothetical protein ABIP07_03725 [Sphingomicrobium sp.]